MTGLLWRIICKLIDKISNTRFYQDITYMISTLFLKSFYRNLQYTNLFTKLPLKESIPYENYGNLNSKICQLLDIFCWVRKKGNLFVSIFAFISTCCVWREQTMSSKPFWDIMFTYLLKCFQIYEGTLEKFVKHQFSIVSCLSRKHFSSHLFWF